MSAVRVKVISDDTPYGVKVIDAKTGEIIKHVRAVKWEARAGQIPIAHLEIGMTAVDLDCGDAFVWIGRHKLSLEQWQQVLALIQSLASTPDA
jgi:hypothetical protein